MSEPLILELKKGLDKIIETGGDSEGEYIKFSDGTLINRGNFSEQNVSFEFGVAPELNRCALKKLPDFKVPFVGKADEIQVFLDIINISEDKPCWIARYGDINGETKPTLTNPGKFTIVKPSNRNADIKVSFLAIGQWKEKEEE